MREQLGVHELLELHELLVFKSLCVTKSSAMQKLVTDEQLKKMMQDDVDMSARHATDLKNHLTNGGLVQ
ncbi:hypothetical protein [Ectobacillus funiculus]|uniref:Spore coat protein n=1 Tax=Ectobacillus funiculus TaxID=137993 RepID=A0ABV5W9E5_9BACI